MYNYWPILSNVKITRVSRYFMLLTIEPATVFANGRPTNISQNVSTNILLISHSPLDHHNGHLCFGAQALC